jgi:hypothetical protein
MIEAPHAAHAMAMADEPRPSRRPPRDERGARDRLGAVSVGMDVFGGLCWGLSSVPSAPPLVVRSAPPAVTAPPAPQASGPPGAASSWDSCAPCRAPLPLSHRARAPRRSPLACPRVRHTYRPARCALGCRPCAGSWGQRGRRHPDAPHAPSSGRTERAPRWGTAPPVSAAWCDTASCGVTRAPRRTGQGPSGAHHAWWGEARRGVRRSPRAPSRIGTQEGSPSGQTTTA